LFDYSVTLQNGKVIYKNFITEKSKKEELLAKKKLQLSRLEERIKGIKSSDSGSKSAE
jgi:hypothetical protein